MALAIVLLASVALPALADTTTGNLSGTVIGSDGHPIPNVAVRAVAPSATYSTKTDEKGFFSVVGVVPDTYTVTMKPAGRFNSVTITGVTVNPLLTTTVNQTLAAQLQTIGSTTSRSSGISAFQPQQPVDTYSINANQITTALGKPHATSEASLLLSLPGAQLDRSGSIVIRGGRENDIGFQFEGIDYTDAFTSQFVNSLRINGVSNFQLTPGAGDATVGNAGTGQVNANVKRGARPAFGSFEQDVAGPLFNHQFAGEYGWATPTGRLSMFTALTGSNDNRDPGRRGVDLNVLGVTQPTTLVTGRDLVGNIVYKFGRDSAQSLQLFYQNQQIDFYARNNFPQNTFRVGNQEWINAFAGLGIPFNAAAQAITPLEYGQTGIGQLLNRPPIGQNQPNDTFKLQYSNSLNTSTFVTAKLYKVNSVVPFDQPYSGTNFTLGATGDIYELQGGRRVGGALDFTRQLGTKHLLAVGGRYEFLQPVFTANSAGLGLLGSALFSNIFDFLPVGACANCNGYLAARFPGGIVPRIPNFDEAPITTRHDYGVYVNDQFQVTDKFKINMGLRLDGTKLNYPSTTAGGFVTGNPACATTSAATLAACGYTSGFFQPQTVSVVGGQLVETFQDVGGLNRISAPEPRLAFAYQFSPRDSFTTSYGRSVQLPSIALIDNLTPRSAFAPFVGIAAKRNVCGVTGDRICRDYADELYWEYQDQLGGVPLQPDKPSTFTNVDASYQHDFGKGISMKVAPFYRRGYDVFARTQSQRFLNGVPLLNAAGAPQLNPAIGSNLGINRTTGAELYITKTANYGFSGTLSLTYVNEFSNVVPTTSREDFFPTIPPASLALGNVYRVGFLSPLTGTLAVQYKTRSGWRINPIVGFDNGFPYGSGLLTSFTLNGVNINVPNTNVTSPAGLGGTTGAVQYVDPVNPGTVFAPHVVATRGTPEKNAAGGVLTAPRINVANLDFEYNRPGSRNTFGLLITNLFNQIYGEPALNTRYQPLATGISGVKSGSLAVAQTPSLGPNFGDLNFGPVRFGQYPYLLTPSGTPTQFRLYYQLSL